MERVRLIIDFNSAEQLAAHVTWLRDSGRFTPEVDAVRTTSEDEAFLCGIDQDHQFTLVPVVREERGPSIFELTAPEPVAEMPPPAHGLAPPREAAPY